MPPLKYCQQCRGAAQEISISGIGDVRRDIFSTPQQRFVFKPCGTCMELRTVFLNKLRRDHNYRLHLARVSTALGCYGCPEHPSDYQFFRPTEAMPMEAWWELSETFLKKFHRQSFQSVSALEICTSNVEYCDSCSTKADDGLEDNIQITPCERCLEVRDAYIDRVYHEVVFTARDIFEWPQDVVFVEEILHIEEFGPDSYRERFIEAKYVKWGVPAANVAPAIAFVLVGSAATIASAVYARRALRMQNRRWDIEDPDRPHDGSIALQPSLSTGSPPISSSSVNPNLLSPPKNSASRPHDGSITLQPSSSTGSPPISSSSVDPNLLSPPKSSAGRPHDGSITLQPSSSTGSPPISSSSVDLNLLSPPKNSAGPPPLLYSQLTPNRPVTPPPNASFPTSTPILNQTSGNHSDVSETHDRDSANYRLAQETSGHFLGAMPPKLFLDTFLPSRQDIPQCPNSKGAFTRVLSANKEVDMYTSFITAATAFVDKLVLVDTHANPDALRDNLAPDISVYAANNVPDADAKTDFSKMELFVELKFAETSDPFHDPEDSLQPQAENFRFENDSDVSRLNRGQLCSYAAAHAGSQFRVHTFTLSICGQFARFIRWDRSGAIVTRSFDCINEPHILASFFWRYAHLNHSQRGYDTSVSPASPEDLQQIQHVAKRLRENPAHREFRIITVPDRDDPKSDTPFIISFPPKYTAHSPFGRATRPMLAFNMETRELVFLKDYWRANVDGIVKEGQIYAILESKGVPNIAPFGKGNDVSNHTTLTHTLRNEKWACWSREMVLLVQYRMSLKVVARHLTSFKSSWEFVSAIADAMAAHQHAYFDAHVLHRDISVDNILITYEGKGLLTDWDLSIILIDPKTGKKPSSARRPDRTGTWQFMSAALLRNNKKCNELEDDRESCLHVLTWTALRFTKHTCSEGDSSMFLRAFDKEYEDESLKGGDLKRASLVTREIPRVVKFDRRPQLDALIEELTEAFAVRYEKPPSDEDFETLTDMQSNNVPPSYLYSNAAFKYKKRLDDLTAPSWLVDTFRRHLSKVDCWLPLDEGGQPISSGSKRCSDGSGSRSGS